MKVRSLSTLFLFISNIEQVIAVMLKVTYKLHLSK
jgi:hypothetical protein